MDKETLLLDQRDHQVGIETQQAPCIWVEIISKEKTSLKVWIQSKKSKTCHLTAAVWFRMGLRKQQYKLHHFQVLKYLKVKNRILRNIP